MPGGIFEQNQWELDAIRVCWQAREIYRDPASIGDRIGGNRKRGIAPNPSIGRFVRWLNKPITAEYGWLYSYFPGN